MATHSPPSSEVSGLNLGPYVGNLLTDGWQFTVQNLDQLYVLVSPAPKNYLS